jgi:site-specific DNA-methyltransferase (adenine-specific)
MRRVEIGDAVLYQGDALEVLDEIQGVDAVFTDPPYSSGGQFRGDRAQDTREKYLESGSSYKLLPNFTGDTRDQLSFLFWSTLWSGKALHSCNPGAIGAFFSDWRQLPISTQYLQAGGWIWRGLVPWVKAQYRPQKGRFGAQCEYIVWGSAGALPLDRGGATLPGFFQYRSPNQYEREHVTQKPLDLMKDLLQIVEPGGLVLDPFMGSGTTGAAALDMGLRFVGIELVPEYFETACRRIEAVANQGRLF